MLDQAATRVLPNSFDIGARPLGNTTLPIFDDGYVTLPGDIVLSRAKTLAMHAIIVLGQIYRFRWDCDDTFRFWSHPAMVVAVPGQVMTSRDGTQQGEVARTVLVQATVNPKGVNYVFLDDFRRDYSSRCQILCPGKFTEDDRKEAVAEAEDQAGEGVFEWLLHQENGLVNQVKINRLAAPPKKDTKQFTYGLLSLLSILTAQLFPKWKLRFFNEGQVTCSSFVAGLMEKGGYSFDSEQHAFPADVAEKLYRDQRPLWDESIDAKSQGIAKLRGLVWQQRGTAFRNATSFRLSPRSWFMVALVLAILGCFLFWALPLGLEQLPWTLSWPLRWLYYGLGGYISIIAAPMFAYATYFTGMIAWKGVPRLIRMARPLYQRDGSRDATQNAISGQPPAL